MRQTWILLTSALLAGVSFGAFWVVRAQDRQPLYPPPLVFPSDEASPPAPQRPAPKPKPQKSAKPAKDKGRPDPTLIIPAAAYDVPRPIAMDERTVPQAEVATSTRVDVPPPVFPAAPQVVEFRSPEVIVPPSVPQLDTTPKPAVPAPELDTTPKPLPTPDPTKVLIVDPPAKEVARPPLPAMEPPVPMPVPAPTALPQPIAPAPGPKSFVPIRSGSRVVPPVSPQADPPQLAPKTVLPIAPHTNGAALGSLQVPRVSIEKRGPATLRAGEAKTYYIVVRNLGPGAASTIRIDDELPAGVRMVSAEPTPASDGNRAAWTLPGLPMGGEQTIRFVLQATADVELPSRLNLHVSAGNPAAANIVVMRPRNDVAALAVEVVPPQGLMVGKPAVFEIRVLNQSQQPLMGVILLGQLPDGVHHPAAQEIKGEIDAGIQPGETKTIRMPTTAVKAGKWTIAVKVSANGGHEASSKADFVIATPDSLQLEQAPSTRMFLGRNGDLRFDVTNHSNKPLRNVAVANRLPDGLDFVMASERGLYQANSRTVHWLVDLPPGATKALIVRVHGTKAGQHQNVVQARADGVPERNSVGIVQMEGAADLSLRAAGRDNVIEVGRETVYEIQIANPGNAAASNVRLQVRFPAGLAPKSCTGNTRGSVDGQTVTIEPIASLGPQSQAIYRVTALAQPTTERDQRVRFAVMSEQVRTPIEREVSTLVVPR